MLKAFFTSATGMRAQELLIDNTANNLANVNTTAYKKSMLEFADLMYETNKQPGAPTADGQTSPIGLQVGNGVRPVGTTTLFNIGTMQQSEKETHMAIEGNGFFKVALPGGQFAYTRDGSFHQDVNGLLVNGDGRPLDPPITIPPDALSISITNDGNVSVIQPGSPVPTPIGQIQLAQFSNEEGLERLGGNLYGETGASGPELPGTPGDQGFGTIRQGFLEGSNVEVVTEMVSLITAQRAYEVNSRAIRAGDEMLSNTSQLIR